MKIHNYALNTFGLMLGFCLVDADQASAQPGMPPGVPMLNIYSSAGWHPSGSMVKLVEGDWVRFSTSWISGEPPFTYQWLRNGVPVPGATEPSLRYDPLIIPDAGVYQVRVSNAYGSAQSDTNNLVVIARPAITQLPAGAALLGGNLTLTVATPPPYSTTNGQWFFNDKPIPSATNAALSIGSATFDDDGEYVYKTDYRDFTGPGMTRYGVRSAAHRLRVYAAFTPPTLVTQPKNQTGLAGGGAVFTVGASGTSPFAYQWKKNGVSIPAATNFFLALSNVTTGDVADYTVVVSGAAGSITSLAAHFTLGSAPMPNAAADSLVASGRASLALQSTTGLQSARAVFGSAVALAPNHELANFFEAVTRVVDLINKPATQSLFDRLLVSPTGRDLYQWEAQATYDSEGNLEAPAVFALADGARHWRDYILPEARAALANLNRTALPGFLAQLTAAETTTSDVTVDQGDLWIARALLHGTEYFGRTLNSWNLEVQLSHLKSLYVTNNELTVQRLLEEFPQLLTISDASQLAPARSALENGVDAYVQGIGMIRARPAGLRRLFNLERDTLAEEERFRQFLLDLKASLAATMTVNEQPQFKLNWGAFNTATNSLRAVLPQFKGLMPDAANLPSTTFGGLIGSDGPPLILFQPLERRFYSGNRLALGVEAIGKSPLRYQWQKNGLNLPDATNATLFLPNAYPNDQGDYQVVISNALGAVTSAVANVALPHNAVAAWGYYFDWSGTMIKEYRIFAPAGLVDVIAISSGDNIDAALKADGTLVCWGPDAEYGPARPFLQSCTNIAAMDIKGSHLIVLRRDGQVEETYLHGGPSGVPPGLNDIQAIAAGYSFGLGLRRNGTVVGWGTGDPVSMLPPGLSNAMAIAASDQFGMALRSNGTVTVWGSAPPVPAGLNGVVAIAAKQSLCLALKQDGRVVQWGSLEIQPPVWLSNVVGIVAHDYFPPAAILADGSLIFWGKMDGLSDLGVIDDAGIFYMSGVTAAALGGRLLVMGPLLIKNPPRDTQTTEGATPSLEVYAASAADSVTYQWLYNGVPIHGATAPMLTLQNVQSSAVGNYSVRVSNGGYTLTSRTAKLRILAMNDSFADTRQIPGGGGRLLGSTLSATRDAEEPYHAGNRGGHSLWFAWQAPANVMVTVDTIGSTFDTLLAVYTGSSLSSLTLVAADDDGAVFNNNSRVSFAAVAGVTYLIAVDGYNGDAGSLMLNVTPQLTIFGLVRASPNQFDMTLAAPASSQVVLEASPDLRLWVPIKTNLAPETGILLLTDPNAAQPSRFYRALLR